MENKNEFDEFVKKMLSQRQHEIKPAHWDGAKKLLDEAFPKRKRKPLPWLWLAAGLMGGTLLTGGGFLVHQRLQQQAPPSTTEQRQITQSGDTLNINNKNNSIKIDNKIIDKEYIKNTAILTGTDKKKVTSENIIHNNHPINKRTSIENAASEEQAITSNNKTNAINKQPNSTKGEETISLDTSAPIYEPDINVTKAAPILATKEPKPLVIDEHKAAVGPPPPYAYHRKPNLEVIAGATTIIGQSKTSVSPLIGAGLAVPVINKSFSATARLLLYQQKSDFFSTSDVSYQTFYSFGKNIEATLPSSIHLYYLETQIQLAYTPSEKTRLQSGIFVTNLLGGTANKARYQKVNLRETLVETNEKQSINTNGLQKWNLGPVLTYEWRASKHLSLGASGAYSILSSHNKYATYPPDSNISSLANQLDNIGTSVISQRLQTPTEDGRFQLRVFATYNFK
jgi:hypothetical protein